LLVGLLIVFFAVQELRGGKKQAIPAAWLPLGGVVSGFFGGLSGNQGAFRSAFLLGAGLGKDAFIARAWSWPASSISPAWASTLAWPDRT
jgi:hypothetical protein